MAAPLTIKRLSVEEFKEAPSWINRLLQWLNQFVEYVAISFSNGITFDENIQSQIKLLEIVAGATPASNTAKFICTLPVTPRGVIVMRITERTGNYSVIGAAVSVEWRFENGSILITSITGLTSGKIYDLSILII